MFSTDQGSSCLEALRSVRRAKIQQLHLSQGTLIQLDAQIYVLEASNSYARHLVISLHQRKAISPNKDWMTHLVRIIFHVPSCRRLNNAATIFD
jgi:hypothetical protein